MIGEQTPVAVLDDVDADETPWPALWVPSGFGLARAGAPEELFDDLKTFPIERRGGPADAYRLVAALGR